MAERGQIESQWIDISAKFPATLDTSKAEVDLEDGESPDAYGLGIELPGLLYKSDAPAGQVFDSIGDKTVPTNAPAEVTARYWHYFHNRLFGWDTGSVVVYFGAEGYDTTLVHQNNSGKLYADNGSDVSNITAICPFGNKTAIFKTDVLYVVDGASSNSAQFSSSFEGEEFGVSNRRNVISLAGTLYFVNSTGLYSLGDNGITEMSRPIRNDLGAFTDTQCTWLKADFNRKYLCLTDGTNTLGVVDLSDQVRILNYVNLNSGFRFTTPTFEGKNGETLIVDKVAFLYRNAGNKAWRIGVDIKINDDWKEEGARTFNDAEYGRIEFDITTVIGCKRWAMRINELSSDVYISSIQARVKQGNIRQYTAERG